MVGGASILFYLAGVHFLTVSSLTVQNITLSGSTNGYVNSRSSSRHSLNCNFRAGYDDIVQKIVWYKDDRVVYEFLYSTTDARAFRDLQGRVRTDGNKLENLNFIKPVPLDVSGNYSCEIVTNSTKTMSRKYSLVVLDIPSDDYVTNVTLLSNVNNTSFDTTEEDNSNCTLLWAFKTPAIYPRPNVTCGYYSYLHDDITSALPAGLIMQRLLNGSWIASFDHTYVNISSIPRESRLGCAVSVPDTSYKRVVKFEDNFLIDHLIDAEGCPSLFLEPSYRLVVTVNGGRINCRGDLEQSSTNVPITVTFSCDPNDVALFPNGTAFTYWSTTRVCDSRQKTWTEQSNGYDSSATGHPFVRQLNQSDIPTCVSWSTATTVKATPQCIMGFLLSVIFCRKFFCSF